MKKLLNTLAFLMIIAVAISACNANDESPAEKKFLVCTGMFFGQIAHCNALAAQYRNEYGSCLLLSKNVYDQATKRCKGSIQEQFSCRLEAQDQYLQSTSVCTSTYNTNSELVAKCQEEAYKTDSACIGEK